MRGSAGFTLIETLVATIAGLIVTAALFTTLEVSLHQTARLTDVAQASQLGRDAMTQIVDELHSACIAPAPGFKPAQAGSTESKLIVIDAYSPAAEIPGATEIHSEGAREDVIEYSKKNETLTDFTHLANPGTAWPEFTFAEAATPANGQRIAEGITPTAREDPKTKKPYHIFTYYKYAKEPKTEAANGINSLEEITLGEGETLSKELAEETAGVAVNFRTAPTSGSGAGSRATQSEATIDLTAQVTFAFSAPNSEGAVVDSPCK